MREAWQCPGCHTWYAPHIDSCDCQSTVEKRVPFIPLQPFSPYTVPIYPYPRYKWPYITWTSSGTNSVTAKDVASGTLVLNPDLAQKYYSTKNAETGDLW